MKKKKPSEYFFSSVKSISSFLKARFCLDTATKKKKHGLISMCLDRKGIPVSKYGFIDGKYIGQQRSIVAIAEKALDYWQKYRLGGPDENFIISYDFNSLLKTTRNDAENKIDATKKFLNCAEWLLGDAVIREETVVWECKYDSYNNTKSPWRSGQAQAAAIRVLIRAYELTSNNQYLECALKAIKPFAIEIEDGGLRQDDPLGGCWYNKFIDLKNEAPKVLNGMMFAVLGLYDFYEKLGSQIAKDCFEQGIIALKQHLPEYDSGNWSYYSQRKTFASEKYHKIHCDQLKQLFDITKDVFFLDYYKKFINYTMQHKGFKKG